MHVNSFHFQFGCLYNSFNMSDLVNGNTKFGINMACRYLEISSSHNMRIQPDQYRIAISEMITELFKNGDIIDVYIYTKFFSLYIFLEVSAIGCKENFIRCKSGPETQLHFMDTNTIKPRSYFLHQL